MILAATRDAARLFLELGTVTVVLAVGARLAARTGFSSIPLYLVAGIVLGALAPPTLDEVLGTHGTNNPWIAGVVRSPASRHSRIT